MNINNIAVSIEQVSKNFVSPQGVVHALDTIDLTIKTREFVTILGPSGCGKSTLLHILGGFDKPSSGRITVRGCDVTSPGRDRGMVFQEAHLFPWRTVLDNVAWPLQVAGTSRREARKRASEQMERVGLGGFEHHRPSQLSGGMRQRAAIARTLIMEPSILLMDEPFGALDAHTREYMQVELSALCRNAGVTVVFITHDISEAVFLGDRVLIMKARPGKFVAEVDIAVTSPRTSEMRSDLAFATYEAKIRQTIGDQWDNIGPRRGVA